MMKIFTVFDSKAEAYLQPFFSPTTATALRAFEKVINEEGSMFGQNPGDYTLFELGSWEECDGRLKELKVKENLGLAITMMKPVPLYAPPGDRRQPVNSEELEEMNERVDRLKAIQGGE